MKMRKLFSDKKTKKAPKAKKTKRVAVFHERGERGPSIEERIEDLEERVLSLEGRKNTKEAVEIDPE